MNRNFATRRGVIHKSAIQGCFYESVSLHGCRHEPVIMKSARSTVMPDASMGRAGQRRTHWLIGVAERLNELAALPDGWDGRRAPAVSLEACMGAAQVLGELADEQIPRPFISPSLDGGLLMEWDRDGIELDVFVEPDGIATVYYEHGDSGWDGDWESRREGVRLVLHHLSTPSHVAV